MDPESTINWEKYFQEIQPVCPWSLPAWRAGRIDMVHGTVSPEELGDFLARVYLVNLSSDALSVISRKHNQMRPDEEWFWSHPEHGGYSAPYPCLIQQRLDHLDQIRAHAESHEEASETHQSKTEQ